MSTGALSFARSSGSGCDAAFGQRDNTADSQTRNADKDNAPSRRPNHSVNKGTDGAVGQQMAVERRTKSMRHHHVVKSKQHAVTFPSLTAGRDAIVVTSAGIHSISC